MATGRVAGGNTAVVPPVLSPASDDREMSLVEHLEELRRVVIVSLIAWVVATAVAFAFNHQLVWILERPLHLALARTHSPFGQRIVITSPIEGLSIPLKVAAFGGTILALPVVVWQVWTFVRPGLKRSERNLAFLSSSDRCSSLLWADYLRTSSFPSD